MTAAFGTDRLAAQRAELDPLDDAVRTMRMIERAHNLQIFRAATRARRRIDNVQAVRAFITALFFWNVLKACVFLDNLVLFFCPNHRIIDGSPQLKNAIIMQSILIYTIECNMYIVTTQKEQNENDRSIRTHSLT